MCDDATAAGRQVTAPAKRAPFVMRTLAGERAEGAIFESSSLSTTRQRRNDGQAPLFSSPPLPLFLRYGE